MVLLGYKYLLLISCIRTKRTIDTWQEGFTKFNDLCYRLVTLDPLEAILMESLQRARVPVQYGAFHTMAHPALAYRVISEDSPPEDSPGAILWSTAECCRAYFHWLTASADKLGFLSHSPPSQSDGPWHPVSQNAQWNLRRPHGGSRSLHGEQVSQEPQGQPRGGDSGPTCSR